ncbi:MAG: DUF6525 family protein [Pseudomonadota bacterium]
MTGNLGHTTLRRKRRRTDPMQDFDRLPRVLRTWLAGAALPWAPASVLRTYGRALRRTGDAAAALAEVDRIEMRLVEKDAAKRITPYGAARLVRASKKTRDRTPKA